jgi:hypothetical protein
LIKFNISQNSTYDKSSNMFHLKSKK